MFKKNKREARCKYKNKSWLLTIRKKIETRERREKTKAQ
mgnify:CR=1 FL=1